MEIGVSSYAFGWAVAERRLDATGVIGWAATHGVRRVQLGDHLPWANDTDAARDDLAEVKRLAARHGITLELGARGLTGAHAEYCVRVAADLGVTVLRFLIDDLGHEPDVDTVVDTAFRLLPALHHHGVTLALENHDRLTAAQLRSVIDAVDDPAVGACVDTANSFGQGEGLGDVLNALAPVCVNLHLKDVMIRRFPHQQGFTVEGTPAGTGQLDLAAALGAAKRSGRCVSAVLEQWVPPEPTAAATVEKEKQWAEQSWTYLRSTVVSRTEGATQ